MQLNNETRK